MAPTRSTEAARAAEATAQILLEIKAVNFRPETPYVFTSGWASPVYIDCRKLISFPKHRAQVVAMAIETIEREVKFSAIDAVAGGETAGIPYAAFLAQARNLPMLYVRKQPKGFGRNAQIEGEAKDGSRVLLVEDLATDGASKINFVNALRTAGLQVSDAFVVFFYGVYRGALETLAQAGLRLHYLATWHDVLAAAEKGRHFPPASIAEVRAFLSDPLAWSAAHGGRGRDTGRMASNDGASTRTGEPRRWEGLHGTFTVEGPVRGVVILKITGHDIGEFGQAPMRELEWHLVDSNRTELFIDARSTDTVSIDVSGDWARWLGAHRSYWARVCMLTGSRYVQITADFVRRFADLGDIMRIYSDPTAFDQALASSIADAKGRAGSA